MSVGTSYGRYFLLKMLATGGMGEIFLARQDGIAGVEKIVVVKRVLSHLTKKAEYLELFLQEARLQARLSHRSIVQIFDLGEAQDGSFYLAMEFVHGKSLIELHRRLRSRRERLPPALAAQIIEQAADGLSYAHGLTDGSGRPINLIHRDISPHNILISYQGEVKLIDFGIAKSEINVVKTETGTIKGKFYYLSPEQSAASELDKRSDLFSLGIVLYECLAGENPFVRQNVVLSLQAIQQTDPPKLASIDSSLAPLDPVVFRALAKNREDRYADASDLKQDLARVREKLPSTSESLGEYLTRLFKDEHAEESKMLAATDSSSLDLLATAAQRAETKSDGELRRLARDSIDLTKDQRPRAGLTRESLAHFTDEPTIVHERAAAVAAPGFDEVRGPADSARQRRRRFARLGAVALAAAPLVAGVSWGVHLVARRDRTASKPAVLGAQALSASPSPSERPAAPPMPPKEVEAARAAEAVKPEDGRQKGHKSTREVGLDESRGALKETGQATATGEKKNAAGAALGEGRGTAEKARPAKPAGGKRSAGEARKAEEAERKVRLATAVLPAGPKIGTLFVKVAGECEMSVNGRPAALGNIDLTGPSGLVELRPLWVASKIGLAYSTSGIELRSEPWSIVYLDGLSVGKTPVSLDLDQGPIRVELKRPGEATVRLQLRYWMNQPAAREP